MASQGPVQPCSPLTLEATHSLIAGLLSRAFAGLGAAKSGGYVNQQGIRVVWTNQGRHASSNVVVDTTLCLCPALHAVVSVTQSFLYARSDRL
jgi:hypothetical protein